MLLHDIVKTSARVAETRSRHAKVAHLRDCLRSLAADEVKTATAYLTGASRQGRVGVGPALLRQTLNMPTASKPILSLAEVDATLSRLKSVHGTGSGAERMRLLEALARRATAEEQRFLGQLLLGELRQGALQGVMMEALASAAELPLAEVRRAVMLAGDLPTVAEVSLTQGRPGLARFRMRVLTPLHPMLAQAAEDIDSALDRLGCPALEYKLDGARIQVHKAGKEVQAFTRKLNRITSAVPEVVEQVAALAAQELILDGETLALRPDGTPHPFQTTMRRFGRKLDVHTLRESLPLSVFFFDLLYLDGEELIDRPAVERWEALTGIVPEPLRIPRRVTEDAGRALAFLDEALARGHEGLMAKDTTAPYEAGNRGSGWLKVKQAHTLDLVVLAAEWGSGRRRGWLSNLHLGARDPTTGGFIMLGKTFKGLTDQMLAWQTQCLQALALGSEDYTLHVRPELVVEIAFNEIQASSQYPGGLALRFARVKRYRTDKTAQDADTIATVRDLYARQGAVKR